MGFEQVGSGAKGIGDMLRLFLLCFCLAASSVLAIEIVNENPHAACEEYVISRELPIYKDPNIFLSNLGLIYSDPKTGWATLMDETPLLTSLRGIVHLMRLAPAREFKNFGAIARIDELADPSFKIARDSARGARKESSEKSEKQ